MYDVMNYLEEVIELIDTILDTKKKRHIVGGVLISVSIMFCGLAITTLTIKMEENNER